MVTAKPHYVFKGGSWWVFRSREVYKKFMLAIKNGDYDWSLQPRKVYHPLSKQRMLIAAQQPY